jgi:hypothetical protein
MAILAIGAGVLLTAGAVAIGGLALELILLLICRNSANLKGASPERARPSTVIHLRGSGTSIGAMEWAEETAA